MAKLTLTVFVRNKEYEKALERGLAQQEEGLQILRAESSHMAACMGLENIILTDAEAYGPMVMEKQEFEKKATDVIITKIYEKYFFETGQKILKTEDAASVWEVFSATGGAGATSFAVTAARMLSMSQDGNILYLNLKERDDYNIYTGFDITEMSDVSPKKKFLYVMRNLPEKLHLEEYLTRDSWGVYCFCPQNGINSFYKEGSGAVIVNKLREEKFFSYIIVDSYCGEDTEYVKIEISDSRDKRRYIYPQKGDFLIKNYWTDTHESSLWTLPQDENSFTFSENKIEISMESDYADAVREITEKIIKQQQRR